MPILRAKIHGSCSQIGAKFDSDFLAKVFPGASVLSYEVVSAVSGDEEKELYPVTPPASDSVEAPQDEDLLRHYRRSGDREALDCLLKRYLRPIRGLVFGMVLDHSLADDVTQEVFLRAFRQLDTYRGEARFSTWLYRLAMNVTYSSLRRQRSTRVEYHAEMVERVGAAEEAVRVALQTELDEQITAALADLSPKLRAVMVLTAIDGASVAEVARIEGCTQATVYWRLHKARRQLTHRLRRYLSL